MPDIVFIFNAPNTLTLYEKNIETLQRNIAIATKYCVDVSKFLFAQT